MQDELQAALDILDAHEGVERHTASDGHRELEINETDSLLERCRQVVNHDEQNSKPKLRIIHHLACSGGSLISKCIASLPNVYLISEVHPFSTLHLSSVKPQYRPTDLISLARHAKVPNLDSYIYHSFKSDTGLLNSHVREQGGTLVLRDHTHVDFCYGEEIKSSPTLIDILSDQFKILKVLTVRDPIDSFLSLKNNGWVHFQPETFDEYCKRYLTLLSSFKSNEILKYESFVDNPTKIMKKIAKKLELPFNKTFLDTFDMMKVTGDSGRSGNSIEKRTRRALDNSFIAEAHSSKNYHALTQKLNYEKCNK